MILIQVLVGLSVLLPLSVAISLGNPRKSDSPTTAWLLSAWAWVTTAFYAVVFAAVLGQQVPSWVGAGVLAAGDGVFAWWLVVVRRVRRESRHPQREEIN